MKVFLLWFPVPRGHARRVLREELPLDPDEPRDPLELFVVRESSGRLGDFRAIQAQVLLMAGSKSPAYLKRAIADLARVLPEARCVELEGLDHAALWNVDVGGKPEAVAPSLLGFF